MTKAKTQRWLQIGGIAITICWMGYITFLVVNDRIRAYNACLYQWWGHEYARYDWNVRDGFGYVPDKHGCDL